MIGFVIFVGALLMLCLELASMYTQFITQKEVLERMPEKKIAVTSKEYYRHFDLAATDLKRPKRKATR